MTLTASPVVVTSSRCGGFYHRFEWNPRSAIVAINGTPRVRIEEEFSGIRSYWISSDARYADTDISADVSDQLQDFDGIVTFWEAEIARLESERIAAQARYQKMAKRAKPWPRKAA